MWTIVSMQLSETMKIGSRQSVEPRIDLIVMYTAFNQTFPNDFGRKHIKSNRLSSESSFCISKRSVCELIVLYVHMLIYKNDIKV